MAVAQEKVPEGYYEEILEKYLDSTTTPTTSTEEKEDLTITDLVGRQLIMDYLAIEQNGQATEANLTALANKYVESIPSITITDKESLINLRVVSNNKANFQNYATEVGVIYRNYASELDRAYGNGSVSLGAGSASMALKMSRVYTSTAAKLKAVSVPADLAEAHLELLNTYLENASAMDNLALSNTDPASSFSGLIAIKNNVEKEKVIISQIEEILNENGT